MMRADQGASTKTCGVADAALSRAVPAQENVVTGKRMAVLAMGPIDGQALVGKSPLRPTLPVTDSTAFSALALMVKIVSVFRCVFMACWAVSRLELDGDSRVSTPQIFESRNGFKMIWIHAGGISAQMVDLKSFGYRSFMMFVRKAMRVNRLGSLSAATSHIENTIMIARSSAPFPAVIFVFADFLKKSLKFIRSHGLHYTMNHGSIVIPAPVYLIENGGVT